MITLVVNSHTILQFPEFETKNTVELMAYAMASF